MVGSNILDMAGRKTKISKKEYRELWSVMRFTQTQLTGTNINQK